MKKKLMWILAMLSGVIVIVIVGFVMMPRGVSEKVVGNSKKHLALARQSEAKTTLLAIYASEKMYNVEKDSYTDDFNALDYEADGDNTYLCGFYQGKSSPKKGPSYNYTGKATVADIPPNAIVTKDGFTVACVGYPDPEGPLDVWTINEKREVVGTSTHPDR